MAQKREEFEKKYANLKIVCAVIALVFAIMVKIVLLKIFLFVCSICFVGNALTMKRKIEAGEEDISKAAEKAARSWGGPMFGFIIATLILYGLAVFLTTEESPGISIAERFPQMSTFAEWMIQQIDQIKQLFMDIIHGRL